MYINNGILEIDDSIVDIYNKADIHGNLYATTNKIKQYDKYAIFLLEQIYADLEFEKRDKNKSKNLIELKKEFQKISKKKDHSL